MAVRRLAETAEVDRDHQRPKDVHVQVDRYHVRHILHKYFAIHRFLHTKSIESIGLLYEDGVVAAEYRSSVL